MKDLKVQIEFRIMNQANNEIHCFVDKKTSNEVFIQLPATEQVWVQVWNPIKDELLLI